MLELKLSKIGNSVGVIIPKEMLSRMHLKEGDKLCVIETQDGFRLTPYDENFARQMNIARRIMDRERDVLRALANA